MWLNTNNINTSTTRFVTSFVSQSAISEGSENIYIYNPTKTFHSAVYLGTFYFEVVVMHQHKYCRPLYMHTINKLRKINIVNHLKKTKINNMLIYKLEQINYS